MAPSRWLNEGLDLEGVMVALGLLLNCLWLYQGPIQIWGLEVKTSPRWETKFMVPPTGGIIVHWAHRVTLWLVPRHERLKLVQVFLSGGTIFDCLMAVQSGLYGMFASDMGLCPWIKLLFLRLKGNKSGYLLFPHLPLLLLTKHPTPSFTPLWCFPPACPAAFTLLLH